MGYEAYKEEVQSIVKKNNRGEYIKVSRIIPEKKTSLESIDIRNMYTDNDGNVQPTSKGVRINSELSPEIIGACLASMGEEELEETMTFYENSKKSKRTEENEEE